MDKVKKILISVAAAIGFLAVIFGFMFLSVGFTVYNKAFYEFEFKKAKAGENAYLFAEDTSYELEISRAELDKVRDRLIAYFSGKEESLQTPVIFDGKEENFYNQNELDHMEDALVIFNAVRLAGWLLLPAGLALVAVSCVFSAKRERLARIARGAIIGASVFIAILGSVGIIIGTGFDAAFNLFHKIVFPQGNWSFPPPSNMISVLACDTLFMDAAFIILGCGVGLAALLLTAGLVIKQKSKKSKPKI